MSQTSKKPSKKSVSRFQYSQNAILGLFFSAPDQVVTGAHIVDHGKNGIVFRHKQSLDERHAIKFSVNVDFWRRPLHRALNNLGTFEISGNPSIPLEFLSIDNCYLIPSRKFKFGQHPEFFIETMNELPYTSHVPDTLKKRTEEFLKDTLGVYPENVGKDNFLLTIDKGKPKIIVIETFGVQSFSKLLSFLPPIEDPKKVDSILLDLARYYLQRKFSPTGEDLTCDPSIRDVASSLFKKVAILAKKWHSETETHTVCREKPFDRSFLTRRNLSGISYLYPQKKEEIERNTGLSL